MNGLSWEDDGAQEGLLTRRSAQSCLTDQELEEYLFNRLSGVTREVVEEHLLVCEHCQERAAEEEQYVGVFRDAARETELEDFARAMNSEPVSAPKPGWREAIAAAWLALMNKRTLFAMGGFLVVAAGVFYSPMLRRPATETAVNLSLTRGVSEMAVNAPSRGALRLTADVAELPPLPQWQVDVVDATGKLELSTQMAAVAGRISWQVKDGLPGGQHWVRLLDPKNGSLVREFGLQVR